MGSKFLFFRTHVSKSWPSATLFVCDADISPLLARGDDDPKMTEEPGVYEVVRQLDQACREAGFFYVVYLSLSMCFHILDNHLSSETNLVSAGGGG